MCGTEGFEQLAAWQKARLLTKQIYEVTRQGAFIKDYGLAGQIQRACVSIMSNIAEGSQRDTTKEYLRFVAIAKGSCAEVRSQLYVALDVGYLPSEEFARLRDMTNEIGRILTGLSAALQRKMERSVRGE